MFLVLHFRNAEMEVTLFSSQKNKFGTELSVFMPPPPPNTCTAPILGVHYTAFYWVALQELAFVFVTSILRLVISAFILLFCVLPVWS